MRQSRNEMMGLLAVLAMGSGTAALAQSVQEEAKAGGKTVKREVKKAGNRVDEALCNDGTAECAAKKARNRVKEAGQRAADEGDKLKDKLDPDSK